MGDDHGVLAGLHIFAVEDDPVARETLRDLFTYFGAHVTVADSARAALTKLRSAVPDVVVADIRLGDRTGVWLLRAAQAARCRAPFVAITAYDYDERQLRAVGFSDVVRKPLERERLFRAILAAAHAR